MLIYHDPDEWEAVHRSSPCAYHRANPGKPFAGCTCSASLGQRRRSDEEIAAIKAKRQREEEDLILSQAERIKARRYGL